MNRFGSGMLPVGYFQKGEGIPVVLLHSSLSSKAQWHPLAQQLSDRFQVIAIDLWGYGETPMPEQQEQFRLSHEVELVEATVNRLAGEEAAFSLVGHSYGGATALRFAWQHPERVKALAVFEPVSFHLLSRQEPVLKSVLQIGPQIQKAIARKQSPIAAVTAFIDFWNTAGAFAEASPKTQQAFIAGAAKLALDFTALTADPLRIDDYSRLTMPMLLMAGRQSPDASLQVIRALESCLPNAFLQWFEAGHMAPLSHAELVNRAIDDFLRRDSA